MEESFEQPLSKTPENPPREERVQELNGLFSEVEGIFEASGRDEAKPYLIPLYDDFRMLNQSSKEETTILWNSNGGLSAEEFDALNLRRKLLSNAIGIMTASGVRHDLNKI